jgi:hypothetical protein
MVRGYRKNEYEGVVEGYVIETGVSFVITLDYNRLAEIFRKKKVKKDNKPATPPPAPATTTGQVSGNEPVNEY